MKLRAYAEFVGVSYKTAWRWWKRGTIQGEKLPSGTILVTEDVSKSPGHEEIVVVYARVSANENRPNLDSQAERLVAYCTAKGWKVHRVVKEVGSGVNDSRRKLLAILADPTITVIVVEHKDRLTRFGFRYIETLLQVQGRRVEVVNVSENAIEDLMADLVSIIYSFCSRLYGQRRAKRKTEKIVQELDNQKAKADESHPEAGEKEEVKETEKTEGALP